MAKIHDVVIVGGGQSGLACGYYAARAGLDFVILDEQSSAGGAWQHAWDSLTLFSPADSSSLPGWLMPKSFHTYPTREEVISYLAGYEQRYDLPLERPVEVTSVRRSEQLFHITAAHTEYQSRAVITATGTWKKPFIPDIPKRETYTGMQLHSAHYKAPEVFRGRKVLVVGEGNSGAQILAEISTVADTTWATLKPPRFLPDEVDGRALFVQASARYKAIQEGRTLPTYDLGSIVMVPSVVNARERGVLQSRSWFIEFYDRGVVWHDGEREEFDAVVWCTGFRYALDQLSDLNVVTENGRVETEGTRSTQCPGLWLVGYGNWTGFASATLIGVGRTARATIEDVTRFLD